ncbi:diguanylate cyclase domain-containing protein [Variovorax sp. LT1R16]|uniref:sensor domain-containing diguanylate cyclase n=1 Tax=Variovorax sp. LT1R16 TaxID=3443728 RepID=UPI003F46D607
MPHTAMNIRLRGLRRALGSLKVRITIGGIAALVLGIGLIAVLLISRAEQDTLRAERHREISEAARTAASLSRRVVELQRALQAVAFRLDPTVLTDDAATARFLEDQPVLRNLYSSLFVATTTGEVRLYADEGGINHSRLDLSDRNYFRRTLQEGRSLVSEPLPGKVSGEPLIVLTQPVRDASGIYAVLGGSLRLSSRDLLDGLVDAQGSEASAMVVVSDGKGRVLAHPDRRRIMTLLSDDVRLGHAFAAWVASGSPVEPQGLVLPQPGEVVSAAGVPGPDWMIWRTRAEAELLAPLHDARRDALIGAIALIALLSAAMLLFLWRLLRPLTLLEHRAQHLFDGLLQPQAGWPVASGEIGSLSRVLRRVGMERVTLEEQNAEVLGRLGSVMGAAPMGIAFVRGSKFELVNAEFCRLMAGEQSDHLARPVRTLFGSDEDFAAFTAHEQAAFRAGLSYAGEWQLLRCDGTRFWAALRSKPVDDMDRSQGTIWTLNDIGAQKAAREQLEWSATHDPLTGLANRKAFALQAQRLVDALPRSLPAALVFIDLDHFKPVNDTAGHLAGDLMLLTVATAIASCVRAGDLAVRMGGDEFALVLERCPHATAVRIADDVRRAIHAVALPWEQGMLRVGASAGVASLREDTPSVDAWLEAADAACYAAKAAGRDTVRSAPGEIA